MNFESIKSRIKDIAVYFAGSVLAQAVAFFLLPVYTKYLSPDSYGYFDVIRTYATFIANFCFLQVHTIVLRYIFEQKEEKTITNSFALVLLSSCLTAICIFVMAQVMYVEYVPLVILYIISSSVANYFSYIARGCGNNVLFAVSGVVAAIINVAINLTLIIGFNSGYVSLYIAYIVSYLIQCAIIFVYLKVGHYIKPVYFDKRLFFDMLKFGIPYALNISAYWFLTSYSKTVISDSLGTYYNGLYAIATKFTTILSLFSTCILMVWQEMSFSKYESIKGDSSKVGEYYSLSNKFTLCFILYCAALLLPVIKIAFPIVIDSSYMDAINIVPLAIIAMIINVYCSYLTSIFTAIKKNTDMLVSSIFGAVVNVVLANLLVTKWQIDGVNIAMIIGLAVNAIVRVLLLKKRIGFRLDLIICILPSLLVIAAYFVYIYTSTWINICFLIAAFLVLILDFRFKIKKLR